MLHECYFVFRTHMAINNEFRLDELTPKESYVKIENPINTVLHSVILYIKFNNKISPQHIFLFRKTI